MERGSLRGFVVGLTIPSFLICSVFLVEFERNKVKKEKEEGKKESKVRVYRLIFELVLLFFLLLVLPRLWAVYDQRQEKSEPMVKQKRKWEEVFPSQFELVPKLESEMEEEGWREFSWWDNEELKNIIILFYQRKVVLGRGAILRYLVNRKSIKERALWGLRHDSLKTLFLSLIKMDQLEAKEKMQEIENLLDEINLSLHKQIQEYSRIHNKE